MTFSEGHHESFLSAKNIFVGFFTTVFGTLLLLQGTVVPFFTLFSIPFILTVPQKNGAPPSLVGLLFFLLILACVYLFFLFLTFRFFIFFASKLHKAGFITCILWFIVFICGFALYDMKIVIFPFVIPPLRF